VTPLVVVVVEVIRGALLLLLLLPLLLHVLLLLPLLLHVLLLLLLLLLHVLLLLLLLHVLLLLLLLLLLHMLLLPTSRLLLVVHGGWRQRGTHAGGRAEGCMVELRLPNSRRKRHLHVEEPFEKHVLSYRGIEPQVWVVLKEEAAGGLDEVAEVEAALLEYLLAQDLQFLVLVYGDGHAVQIERAGKVGKLGGLHRRQVLLALDMLARVVNDSVLHGHVHLAAREVSERVAAASSAPLVAIAIDRHSDGVGAAVRYRLLLSLAPKVS